MSKNKTKLEHTRQNRQGKSQAGFIAQNILLVVAATIAVVYAIASWAFFYKFESTKISSSSSSPNQSQQSCKAAVLSSAATTLQGCEFYRAYDPEDFVNRIWTIESSGQLNSPAGDAGKAIGPMQIHQCVLDDINAHCRTSFDANDCLDIDKAKMIVQLYVTVWLERNLEEILVRIYNGGPRGWRKQATDKYWAKYKETEKCEQKN